MIAKELVSKIDEIGAPDMPVELWINDQVKQIHGVVLKYNRDTGKPVLVIHP